MKPAPTPQPTGKVECGCCYCGSPQLVDPAPALHDCATCGHPFRVYTRPVGVNPIEITPEARQYFLDRIRRSA